MWTHTLAFVLSLGAGLDSAAPSRTPAELVTRLVAQLGSSKFKDRETAMQELDTLGVSALPALRQAAAVADPEVRRRADILVKQIQQRLETAQLLQPKQVHLVYKDIPLSEAAADLAARTGLDLHLEGVDRSRKITFDSGPTSFWEAFDRFCKQAELVERTPNHTERSQQEVRIWNARGAVGGRMVIVDRTQGMGAADTSEDRVTLISGKPPLLPTCYAGALRVRTLPAKGKAFGQTRDETLVLFEVSPQPKLSWLGTLEVRIDQAVDEHGQKLFPAPPNSSNQAEVMARRMGNGVVLVDSDTGRVIQGGAAFPVRLKQATKPSTVLKELKGAVTGHVKTPPQAIVSVDDILHAAGRSFKGTDGCVLKVAEVTRMENDHYRLRIRLEGSPEVANLAVNRRMLRGGRMIVRANAVRGGEGHLTLEDAQGRSFMVAESDSTWEAAIIASGVVQEIDTIYYARAGQGPPTKLVFTNRRTVTVEVPFTLKDVPLP